MSDKYAELRSAFAAPPRSFAPMPALLLNDDLSEEALNYSLEELTSKGIGGVFLHPRAGLEVEYLSGEYWENLRFAVARCADLGLDVWLCDEYNWPSGTAAGALLVEHPKYRQRYLDYTTADVRSGTPLGLEIPGEFLAARALCGDDLTDLVGEIGDGKLSWTPAASGQIIAFFIGDASGVMPVGSNAPWMGAERPGYLDVLNAEAVAAFMQRTHDEYDHHLSEYYGTVIKGVFTQEPANYHGWQWTPRLPERFRARKGYDLLAFLHELVWPIGDYVKTRCDYHQVARDLYVEAFYAPIASWAKERDLSFAGSIFRESDLVHQSGLHGEVFTPLGTMDMPGTRWQGGKHGYEATASRSAPAPNVGPKIVSSAAHASGAQRALIEIAGGAGWQINLSQLRAMINWAFATGIDFIKPHAVHLSLKGMRKRGYPPSHFVQEPWWRYYLDLTDYSTRLSYLLSQGIHAADIALLRPTQSLWIEHTLKGPQNRAHEIGDDCVAITDALLHLQRDFDYVFEEAIAGDTVRVEEGKLVVGAESFSVLILPPLTALPLKVLSLAREMVEGGGMVLALGKLPVASRFASRDRDLLNQIEAIWGPRARRLAAGEVERLPGPKKERLGERIERIHHSGGRAIYVAWSTPLTEEVAETILSDLLADGPEPDLTIDSPQGRDFIYVHRRVDEAEVYFIVNLGSKTAEATLGLPALGRVEYWDAMTGEVTAVPVYRHSNGRVQVPQTFAPGEGIILVLTPQEEATHLDEARSCAVLELADGQADIRVQGPNPLLRVGGREIPVPAESTLPPLRFRHNWQVEWDGPNAWLLEPWRVTTLGAESVGSEGQQPRSLREPERLSVRARLTVGALRGARRLVGHIRPAVGSMRTARFIPMEELTRQAVRLLSTLGIDAEELHSYEILRLVRELGQETGLGFKEAFLPPGARYEATASFYADFVPPDLMLVYEDLGEPLEVLINGVPVADPSRRLDVWDRSNRVLNLGSRAVSGRNSITIRSRVPSFPTTMPSVHSLEPVALLGDFMVKGRHIIPPQRQVQTGDWAEMGLPHYSGRVTYTQRFRLPSTYIGQDLVLEFENVRETVEVWVNGESAGYRIWPPYCLPVGHLMREGDNELKVAVTNTAANLLGRPEPSGLLGAVRIVSYPRHRVSLLEEDGTAKEEQFPIE